MRLFFNIFMCLVCSIVSAQSFYDLNIKSIDGKNINFSSFKDKYVLIVNVASRCGYTKQYEDLQTMYEAYDNLIVLGTPCNQFGYQEPKNETEIMQFCANNYNVSFPMTKKINVKGSNQHPVYQWLTQQKLNHFKDLKVTWNFNKFLIGPNGQLIEYFPSRIKPTSPAITSLIK